LKKKGEVTSKLISLLTGMSDTISFRYSGNMDQYNKFKSSKISEGKTMEETFSSFIDQELLFINHNEADNNKTASRHEDELKESLMNTDLSKVIMQGSYHVDIDSIDFIQAASHDLDRRVSGAVHTAIASYWIKRWATVKVNNMSEGMLQDRIDNIAHGAEESKHTIIKQEITKINLVPEKLETFYKAVDRVKVTFTCNIPIITLSDLREKDLGKVIQFDCIIIGPTPKKLDIETGKYIQHVLIQEIESQARNNNPIMIKSILHGDDTNNIASGMTKRFIGVYTVQEPKNGAKVESEKMLIIDTMFIQDLEEKAEVTLTPHELTIVKEMADIDTENYITKLIGSFCPKIYGRELEKKALYLSLLGGSDFEGYRKESHLMLVGEADTGKSELVKFANTVTQKSSIVDGSNATGVGLMFALDDYDGMKILRQGAMILNSGGHMIVDEYDKMPKQEQKKLNQAMEQQRATYNKGGHMGNAVCKTAIIASCNPENERWNEGKTIIDNLPFDASTISRFDLLIRLKHETLENQIRAKMLHITKSKRGEMEQAAKPEWIKGLLNYLRLLKPIFTPEAEELLINKYVEFTMIEQEDGSLPIQTRQMEGIQRLCEAWAKLFFKTKIDTDIVEDVITFYQECLATIGMKVDKGISQMDLRGHSTNKEVYFEDCFRELAKDNDDGFVYIHDLASELSKNHKLFYSDDTILRYVEARKTKGWLYEPKVGVLKKQ
jgi:DNA replicative helicase MCM subunit Mcm2 (Cdc46/Mcm family)